MILGNKIMSAMYELVTNRPIIKTICTDPPNVFGSLSSSSDDDDETPEVQHVGKTFNIFIKELDCPVLDIGKRIGSTDYLDCIKVEEMTAPVMKGIDRFSRRFVAIKMVAKLLDGTDAKFFQVFFHRYTKNLYLWVGCNTYGSNFICTVGGMRNQDFQLVTDILSGCKCDPKDYHEVGLLEDISSVELDK